MTTILIDLEVLSSVPFGALRSSWSLRPTKSLMRMNLTRLNRRQQKLPNPKLPRKPRARPLTKEHPSNAESRHYKEAKFKVQLTTRNTGRPFVPELVTPKSESNGLWVLKQSESWASGFRSKKIERRFPYIDFDGRIHATTICRWRCSNIQLLASIAATVFKRLWGNFRKFDFRKRPKPNTLFEVSMVYALTNDDYWFSRTLEILKRGLKVRNHLYYRIHKLDEHTKVLFDQACQNALWFQSRTRKPSRATSTRLIRCGKKSDTSCLPWPFGHVTNDFSINRKLKDWGSVFTPTSQSTSYH